ncbi:MAG: bifunctional tetrahydrofolate synthase/dihydrofolate synthase [Cellvibrio sp.]|nr:bifunctional tetrahydrofolate synthase/dihydrofolate synthase [Cellvibrio sp.]
MKHESLTDWLSWLEQSHPREIDLGLGRITQVASRLDLLSPQALIVTVAGTNGKGSCVATSAEILRAAGYSVGVYTSPHLLHYNERIRINNRLATDEEICEAFAAIHRACEQESVSLTYFEYGTLAAFYLFKKHQTTAMVLEVGLGGRLDAVNILDADIAIITSIDLDHQDWLGDTREKIGFEKAGIMRANHPMICADPNPPESLINHAKSLNTKSYFVGEDFFYESESNQWRWWNQSLTEDHWQELPQLPLPSVAAALQMASVLKLDFAQLDLFNRVAALRIPGRFQQLTWNSRHWVMDVAHNPAATAFLAKRLLNWKQQSSSTKIHAIVAMMSDKDRLESLTNLRSIIDQWHLLDLSFLPRAANIAQLTENLMSIGQAPVSAGDMNSCVQKVLATSQSQDLIVIFGSFYTVAEAMKLIPILES